VVVTVSSLYGVSAIRAGARSNGTEAAQPRAVRQFVKSTNPMRARRLTIKRRCRFWSRENDFRRAELRSATSLPECRKRMVSARVSIPIRTSSLMTGTWWLFAARDQLQRRSEVGIRTQRLDVCRRRLFVARSS
jgi:hypothetical protein